MEAFMDHSNYMPSIYIKLSDCLGINKKLQYI